MPSLTARHAPAHDAPQPLGVRGEERADLVAALGSGGHGSASWRLAGFRSSSGAARCAVLRGS